MDDAEILIPDGDNPVALNLTTTAITSLKKVTPQSGII
jgi:hypothetical protein